MATLEELLAQIENQAPVESFAAPTAAAAPTIPVMLAQARDQPYSDVSTGLTGLIEQAAGPVPLVSPTVAPRQMTQDELAALEEWRLQQAVERGARMPKALQQQMAAPRWTGTSVKELYSDPNYVSGSEQARGQLEREYFRSRAKWIDENIKKKADKEAALAAVRTEMGPFSKAPESTASQVVGDLVTGFKAGLRGLGANIGEVVSGPEGWKPRGDWTDAFNPALQKQWAENERQDYSFKAKNAALYQQELLRKSETLTGDIGAMIKSLREEPILAGTTITETAPSLIPALLVGAATAPLGATAGAIAVRKGIQSITQAGLGMAQARETVYDRLMATPDEAWNNDPDFVQRVQALTSSGVQEADARQTIKSQIASERSRIAGAYGAAAGAVAGRTGVEAMLAGQAAAGARARLGRAAAELGGELLEEVPPVLEATRQQQALAPETPWRTDVGQTLVSTVVGAGPQAGLAAAGRGEAREQPGAAPGAPGAAPGAPGAEPTEVRPGVMGPPRESFVDRANAQIMDVQRQIEAINYDQNLTEDEKVANRAPLEQTVQQWQGALEQYQNPETVQQARAEVERLTQQVIDLEADTLGDQESNLKLAGAYNAQLQEWNRLIDSFSGMTEAQLEGAIQSRQRILDEADPQRGVLKDADRARLTREMDFATGILTDRQLIQTPTERAFAARARSIFERDQFGNPIYPDTAFMDAAQLPTALNGYTDMAASEISWALDNPKWTKAERASIVTRARRLASSASRASQIAQMNKADAEREFRQLVQVLGGRDPDLPRLLELASAISALSDRPLSFGEAKKRALEAITPDLPIIGTPGANTPNEPPPPIGLKPDEADPVKAFEWFKGRQDLARQPTAAQQTQIAGELGVLTTGNTAMSMPVLRALGIRFAAMPDTHQGTLGVYYGSANRYDGLKAILGLRVQSWFMAYSENSRMHTAAHEVGHALDDMRRSGRYISDELGVFDVGKQARAEIERAHRNFVSGTGGLDFRYPLEYGWHNSYLSKNSLQNVELFAQVMGYYRSDPTALATEAPVAYAMAKEIIDGLNAAAQSGQLDQRGIVDVVYAAVSKAAGAPGAPSGTTPATGPGGGNLVPPSGGAVPAMEPGVPAPPTGGAAGLGVAPTAAPAQGVVDAQNAVTEFIRGQTSLLGPAQRLAAQERIVLNAIADVEAARDAELGLREPVRGAQERAGTGARAAGGPAQPAARPGAARAQPAAAAERVEAPAARTAGRVALPPSDEVLATLQASPGFYSALREEITKRGPGSATGEQWAQTLVAWAKAGKFKQAELEASGLADALVVNPNERISKADVITALDQGGVIPYEVVVTEGSKLLANEKQMWLDAHNKAEAARRTRAREISNISYETGISENDVGIVLGPTVSEGKRADNEEYLLNTAPDDQAKADLKTSFAALRKANDDLAAAQAEIKRIDLLGQNRGPKWGIYSAEGMQDYHEMALVVPGKTRYVVPQKHHFADDDANVNRVAHVRFGTFWNPRGKNLNIDEIQSDWAQDVRDQQYDEAEPTKQAGPFTKSTEAATALAMKRMIRWAVDNGFKSVSWTNGSEQIDRYGLEEKPKNVTVHQNRRTGKWIASAVGEYRTILKKAGDTAEAAVKRLELSPADEAKVLKSLARADGARPMLTVPVNKSTIGGRGMMSFYGDDRGFDVDGKPSMMMIVARDILKKLDPSITIKSVDGNPTFEITPKLAEQVRTVGMPLFAKSNLTLLDADPNAKTATPDSVMSALARIFGASKENIARLLPNVEIRSARDLSPNGYLYVGNRTVNASGAAAFYDPKSGKVVIFADRIPAGSEFSVIYHELFHKRGEALLGKELLQRFRDEVKLWRNAPAGSKERAVYDAAFKRARASTHNQSAGRIASEAYENGQNPWLQRRELSPFEVGVMQAADSDVMQSERARLGLVPTDNTLVYKDKDGKWWRFESETKGQMDGIRKLGKERAAAVFNEELLPYFIEEAINLGYRYDPKLATDAGWKGIVTRLINWMREKVGVQFGIAPRELTVEDLLAAAYGASQLELPGQLQALGQRRARQVLTERGFGRALTATTKELGARKTSLKGPLASDVVFATEPAGGTINTNLKYNADNLYRPDSSQRVRTLDELDALINNGTLPSVGWATQARDRFIEHWMDSQRPFLNWLRDKGLLKASNAWRELKLITGKLRAKIDGYQRDMLDPLMADINKFATKYKLDPAIAAEHIGQWATLRHIPEANAALRAKLRDAVSRGEPGAATRLRQFDQTQAGALPFGDERRARMAGGLTDAEANSRRERIEQLYTRAELETFGDKIVENFRSLRDEAVKSGQLSKDVVKTFPKFQHYVALTGTPWDGEQSDAFGSYVAPNFLLTRDGRVDLADSAVVALVDRVGRVAHYAASADFKAELNKLYEAAGGEKNVAGISKLDSKTGSTIFTSDIIWQDPKDGKRYIFRFDDKRVSESLLGKNNEYFDNAGFRMIDRATRAFSRAWTTWTLAFGPVNMIRDVGEKSWLLASREVYDGQGNRVQARPLFEGAWRNASAMETWRAAYEIARTGKADESTQAGRYANEFIRNGGSSTFGETLRRGRDSIAAEIKRQGGLRKNMATIGKFVESWNTTFELVSGLSSHAAMRELGVDPKEAAFQALDLMNFSQQGSKVRWLRPLYAFFNPTVQSGLNVARQLNTKTGQMQFLAMIAISTMIYGFAKMLAPDDEDLGDGLDKRGSFEIERNVPLFLIDQENPVKIPVPFGLSQLAWATVVNSFRYASGRYDAQSALAQQVVSLFKNFSPVPISEVEFTKQPSNFIVKTFTPTIARPIVDLATDTNSWGGKMTAYFPDKTQYLSEQGAASTPTVYKEMARVSRETLGIDYYPEQWRALLEGYAWGPLGYALKSVAQSKAAIEGRTPDVIDQLPGSSLLRLMGGSRFIGGTSRFLEAKYHEQYDKALKNTRDFKAADTRGEGAEWKLQHPEAWDRVQALKAQETVMRSITKDYNALLKGMQNDTIDLQSGFDKLESLGNQRQEQMRNFLRLVNEWDDEEDYE